MSTRIQRQSNKSEGERLLNELKRLLSLPENKKCADCKAKDPRWASHNLGIFICIKCSGHHRAMGTHISKVKSVDLDTWEEAQLKNMQRWGNLKANLYWEANIAVGRSKHRDIRDFIICKYEHKAFCRKGPFPDPDSLEDPMAIEIEHAKKLAQEKSRNSADLLNLDSLSTSSTLSSSTTLKSKTNPSFSSLTTSSNMSLSTENLSLSSFSFPSPSKSTFQLSPFTSFFNEKENSTHGSPNGFQPNPKEVILSLYQKPKSSHANLSFANMNGSFADFSHFN